MLVGALRERVPAELISSGGGIPPGVLLGRLSARLENDLGLAPEAARWAVESWAVALGMVAPAGLPKQPAPARAGTKAAAGGRGTTGNKPGVGGRTTRSTAAAAPSPVQTLIVDPGRPGALQTIGEAVRQAAAGSRILVRPGWYRESIILDKALEIAGGGPTDQIVIEGSGPPCMEVRRGASTVRGLTFRHSGGTETRICNAVWVYQPAKLTLEDCVVTSSGVPDRSAAVSVDGEAQIRRCRVEGSWIGIRFQGTHPGLAEDCTVGGSTHAALVSIEGASPEVRRCTLSSPNGAVVVTGSGRARFEACEMDGDGYAGLAIWDAANPTVRGCTIRSAQASAVMFYLAGRGTLSECVIATPSTFYAVQIAEKSTPALQQCRISGGVTVLEESLATLEDCTIDNPKTHIVNINGSTATLRRCLLHKGVSGFVVSGRGTGHAADCRITENSRCGADISEGAVATLRGCTITGNAMEAVWVHKKATATVENCDLRGNGKGAWDIGWGSKVTRANNQG